LTNEVEGSPRQKPSSPKRLPFRHKTNLPREISGIRGSVKYSQPATTAGRIVAFDRSVPRQSNLREEHDVIAGISRLNPEFTPTLARTE
jgi:hypothetical protein